MTNIRPFSLLMSVYAREDAVLLSTALESVLVNQTIKPAEIVLIEDGPLTKQLEEVLDHYRILFPKWISVKLAHNSGLGVALNEGMKRCSYDLVARMDSDDISMPERFEKQWNYMEQHPELDVLGCSVAEFEDDPSKPSYLRVCPKNIDKVIKFRSPLNHPTVFFKKKAVLEAGGYQHCLLMEDYFLWVRMYANGSQLSSISEPLYLFRMTNQTQKRRGGGIYANSEKKIQKALLEKKIISYPLYIRNMIIRVGGRYMPAKLRTLIYHIFLRHKI